jgi:hypothetical protein
MRVMNAVNRGLAAFPNERYIKDPLFPFPIATSEKASTGTMSGIGAELRTFFHFEVNNRKNQFYEGKGEFLRTFSDFFLETLNELRIRGSKLSAEENDEIYSNSPWFELRRRLNFRGM